MKTKIELMTEYLNQAPTFDLDNEQLKEDITKAQDIYFSSYMRRADVLLEENGGLDANKLKCNFEFGGRKTFHSFMQDFQVMCEKGYKLTEKSDFEKSTFPTIKNIEILGCKADTSFMGDTKVILHKPQSVIDSDLKAIAEYYTKLALDKLEESKANYFCEDASLDYIAIQELADKEKKAQEEETLALEELIKMRDMVRVATKEESKPVIAWLEGKESIIFTELQEAFEDMSNTILSQILSTTGYQNKRVEIEGKRVKRWVLTVS